MKCPHCSVSFHREPTRFGPFALRNLVWILYGQECPECHEQIVELECRRVNPPSNLHGAPVVNLYLAYPQNTSARPLPPEVVDPYRKDFDEAVAVLPLSAKASAALSRRILQTMLREKAATKQRDLADQIEEIIAQGHMPTHILEGLDAVRQTGNFAAHPIKSKSTGEIVEVETGEAEWNLDILESLFDYYFVQPALTAKRRAALDAKLKDAGKPLLK